MWVECKSVVQYGLNAIKNSVQTTFFHDLCCKQIVCHCEKQWEKIQGPELTTLKWCLPEQDKSLSRVPICAFLSVFYSLYTASQVLVRHVIPFFVNGRLHRSCPDALSAHISLAVNFL